MKITPEIEAVARAIYECRNGHGCSTFSRKPIAHKEPYYLDAIAAIRALRAPSAEQIEAGNCGAGASTPSHYTAMIDAALGENE